MDVKITPQEIVKQNELQMNLLKAGEFTSYVMGYHVYKDHWTLVKSEMLKAAVEPKNKEDKFAVAIMKDDCLVGKRNQKKKLENLQKLFFTFFKPVI